MTITTELVHARFTKRAMYAVFNVVRFHFDSYARSSIAYNFMRKPSFSTVVKALDRIPQANKVVGSRLIRLGRFPGHRRQTKTTKVAHEGGYTQIYGRFFFFHYFHRANGSSVGGHNECCSRRGKRKEDARTQNIHVCFMRTVRVVIRVRTTISWFDQQSRWTAQ